jgi:hypothetical protein
MSASAKKKCPFLVRGKELQNKAQRSIIDGSDWGIMGVTAGGACVGGAAGGG